MDRRRENLNPEEAGLALERPTRYQTGNNRHPLRCTDCGVLYFVDEETLRKATAALEGDPAEITFTCDDCEDEYGEAARAR